MNQRPTDSSSTPNQGPTRAAPELYARGSFAKELSNIGGLPDLLSTCGNPRPFAAEAALFSDPIPLFQSGAGTKLRFPNADSPVGSLAGNVRGNLQYYPMTIMRPASDVTAIVVTAREGYISSGVQMHNRAPAPALGRFTGLLAATSWDSSQYAPPCKVMAVHLYKRTRGRDPAVNVVTLTAFDAELRAGTGHITDHVLLNLSSLGQADVGRLSKFGSNIIDISDTHTGTFAAVDSPAFDPVLDQVVSDSLSKHDREFCLFMCALPICNFVRNTTNLVLPEYNLVDHAVSLFGPRPGPFFPRGNARGALIRYARVLKTLFIQTAALRHGVLPCIENSRRGPGIYDDVENFFTFNVDKISEGEMAWVPYELVPLMGGTDLSKPQPFVGSVFGNRVEQDIHVPRSVVRRNNARWRNVSDVPTDTANPYLAGNAFVPLSVFGRDRGDVSTLEAWRKVDEPEVCQVGNWKGNLSSFREI